MALFQKKPHVSSSAPLYTLGLNKTILVVGLGNIGKDYENTRHNIGFETINDFIKLQNFPEWVNKRDLKAHITSGNIGSARVIAARPTTFMNLSGAAVQAVENFYKINPTDIVVIHDELDIPFGQIRTRLGGGSAGHKGVESVSERIGPDYYRIRIGIGSEQSAKIDSANFVLDKFNPDELNQMDLLKREVNSMLTEFIVGGTMPNETRRFVFE